MKRTKTACCTCRNVLIDRCGCMYLVTSWLERLRWKQDSTEFELWMCVRAQSVRGGAIFEALRSDESTGIILQCYCTTSPCGWTLAGSGRQAYTHSCRSLGPGSLINPTILCRAIGTVRLQRATPSLLPPAETQPLTAAGCTQKHPWLVQSLGPSEEEEGEDIYSVCSDRNSQCCTSERARLRWLLESGASERIKLGWIRALRSQM